MPSYDIRSGNLGLGNYLFIFDVLIFKNLYPCQLSKDCDKNDETVVKKKFGKWRQNAVIIALKWRHISKFLRSIERCDKYHSFGMPIKFLRELVTALGKIFSFSPLYTGHLTSSEHSCDPINVIFGQKRKKLGILEIVSRSIVWHQIVKIHF